MHISVMPEELITGLNINDDSVYIDCTFGAGGHTRAILEANKTVKVIALDRDYNAASTAKEFAMEFRDRFEFKNLRFSDLDLAIPGKVDGIIYDIGVSSMQLDQADRGFSFNKSGPLSMEMGLNTITAEDIVNSYPEQELANLIYKFGDERKSRIIAKRIVEYRKKSPINDTLVLANIVAGAVGRYNDAIHPATRTFQALRIAVNNELGELESSLVKAIDKLNTGGRICVITFHSLEDKIVKALFNKYAGKQRISFDRNYHDVDNNDGEKESSATLRIITKKPTIPSSTEVKSNIRSRSAKLRIAERI